MTKVFASHNNIVSSLGFSTEAVIEHVKNGKSGLKLMDDLKILPVPFYTSLINTDTLTNEFEKLGASQTYSRLEKMMVTSLNSVINDAKVSLSNRVGLIISTTKGNVDALDTENPLNEEKAYLADLGNTIKDFFGFKNDAIIVSNACVSGILAVAIAKRYIQQGIYDDVFIVSGDIISEFILSGFNSFQALSDEPCKPYCKHRKGINIGEVAASILVTSNEEKLSDDAVEIIGEGSCNDANHISGPSRTGEGLYRSIQAAIKEANINAIEIDYISAHGTATLYNDEMESIAFSRSNLLHAPVNSLKGYFGHTLGASGLLEAIIGMQSLKNNTLYKSLGFEEIGVSEPINVIKDVQEKELTIFLKTASGFGGCNTAVVFKKLNTK